MAFAAAVAVIKSEDVSRNSHLNHDYIIHLWVYGFVHPTVAVRRRHDWRRTVVLWFLAVRPNSSRVVSLNEMNRLLKQAIQLQLNFFLLLW